MVEEVSALHKIDTWDIVSLPLGKSANGSCWVYKIKAKPDGYEEIQSSLGCQRVFSTVWYVVHVLVSLFLLPLQFIG